MTSAPIFVSTSSHDDKSKIGEKERRGRSEDLMSEDRREAGVTGSQASLGPRESGLEAGGVRDRASSVAALANLEDDIKVHTLSG